MTNRSAAATIRSPDTANSRAMITIATHADSLPSEISATRAAVTSSLSASGSRKAPRTVFSRATAGEVPVERVGGRRQREGRRRQPRAVRHRGQQEGHEDGDQQDPEQGDGIGQVQRLLHEHLTTRSYPNASVTSAWTMSPRPTPDGSTPSTNVTPSTSGACPRLLPTATTPSRRVLDARRVDHRLDHHLDPRADQLLVLGGRDREQRRR